MRATGNSSSRNMPILSVYTRHGSRVSGLLCREQPAGEWAEGDGCQSPAEGLPVEFGSKDRGLHHYTSTRRDKLQAALYLPANYEAGKRYPAMVEICEKESQGAN